MAHTCIIYVFISSHAPGQRFSSTTAFSIHCKRKITPGKQVCTAMPQDGSCGAKPAAEQLYGR